ncbi:MAG: hypothetical protein R2825_17155 [Saprospiraceae bacterium]
MKNHQGKYAEAELGYGALAIDPNYLPDVFYSLAIVEFDQEKFAESAEHMEKYLESEKISPKRKITAEAYYKSAKFSAYAYANPVPYEPINMGPNINTQLSEYFPTLTADEKTSNLLHLPSEPSGHSHEDFFRSQKIQWDMVCGVSRLLLLIPWK